MKLFLYFFPLIFFGYELRAASAPKQINVFHEVPVRAEGISSFRLFCVRSKSPSGALKLEALHHGNQKAALLISKNWGCFRNKKEEAEAQEGFETSIQVVRLSEKLEGLLVRARSGGEAIYDVNMLVVFQDGKLQALWQRSYGTEEESSINNNVVHASYDAKKRRGVFDHTYPFVPSEILLFDSYADDTFSEDDIREDTWAHESFEYDPDKKKLISKPVQDFAVILAAVTKRLEAIQLKFKLGKNKSCAMQNFMILAAESVDPVKKGKYLLTAVTTTEAKARELAKRPKECEERPLAVVQPIRQAGK